LITAIRKYLTVTLAAALAALALAALVTMPRGHAPVTASAQGRPAVAVLAASVCTNKTTQSYSDASSWSASAGTTVKQTWTTKIACGSDYQKWETVTSSSADGAHYTEKIYRDERSYPHYWQQTQKWSWTKAGAFSYSSVVITA
jgi:hypothetical protein